MRVAIAQLNFTVIDFTGNRRRIEAAIHAAREAGARLVVLSELAATGYPPRDLAERDDVIERNLALVHEIAALTDGSLAVLMGLLEPNTNPAGKPLYNSAALLDDGALAATVRKSLLPTYDVFDEGRHFEPGPPPAPLTLDGLRLGVTICEDMWNDATVWPRRAYHRDPVEELAAQGVDAFINLSASPWHTGKADLRERLAARYASRHAAPFLYANQVGGNDELVFDGRSFVVDASGHTVARAAAWREDLLLIDLLTGAAAAASPATSGRRPLHVRAISPAIVAATATDATAEALARPTSDAIVAATATDATAEALAPPTSDAIVAATATDATAEALAPPSSDAIVAATATDASVRGAAAHWAQGLAPDPLVNSAFRELEELREALVLGTRDYVLKSGFTGATLGLSGGIDSALVAAIAAQALGPEHVWGVAMPTRYSSDHSLRDAYDLARNLGIHHDVVPIDGVFASLLDALQPLFVGTEPGVAEENLQARARGVVMMGLSNKFNRLLLTTGNKSELAVGYCTLYGDMCGALAVISDLPKTQVFALCHHLNETAGREIIPHSTLTKPPSAELRPDQTDQDTLPPYDVLDEIIHLYVKEQRGAAEIIEEGHDPEVVRFVVRLINLNEYKRKQAAPGLKLTPRAFGTGRRMPLVAGYHTLLPPLG